MLRGDGRGFFFLIVPVFIGSVQARRALSIVADTHQSLASDELFNPTDAHRQLRTLCANFAESRIAPQAAEYDRKGKGVRGEMAQDTSPSGV